MSDGLIAIETRPVRNRFPPGWAKPRHLPRQRIALRQRQNDSSTLQSDAWLAFANARMHLVHDWDNLVAARAVGTVQAEGLDLGVLAAVYRQLGNNFEIGVGLKFGQISGDLTALTDDSQGAFINLIASF